MEIGQPPALTRNVTDVAVPAGSGSKWRTLLITLSPVKDQPGGMTGVPVMLYAVPTSAPEAFVIYSVTSVPAQ